MAYPDVVKVLQINQSFQAMAPGKSINKSFPMLEGAPRQVALDAGIQDAVASIGHKINPATPHEPIKTRRGWPGQARTGRALGPTTSGNKALAIMTVFIDADACPVKQETYRVAERHAPKGIALKVLVVSNSRIAVPRDEIVERVVVCSGMDEAG